MTKVKLCGLSRFQDIEAVNRLKPDYIGFVFAAKSKRYVTPAQAAKLKGQLAPDIQAVGVFVNAPVEQVAALLNNGTIDIAQLHGQEDAAYIQALRQRTDKPIWQAFRVSSLADVARAEESPADGILLDSGAGTGNVFDWSLLRQVQRPYFLAGGLDGTNVTDAIRTVRPYGVDVSSGIETDGRKDPEKMAQFVAAVRKEEVL